MKIFIKQNKLKKKQKQKKKKNKKKFNKDIKVKESLKNLSINLINKKYKKSKMIILLENKE